MRVVRLKKKTKTKNTNLFWFVLFVSIRPLTLKAIKADYIKPPPAHHHCVSVCAGQKKRPPNQIAGQRDMWLFCWSKVYKNKNSRLLLFVGQLVFNFYTAGYPLICAWLWIFLFWLVPSFLCWAAWQWLAVRFKVFCPSDWPSSANRILKSWRRKRKEKNSNKFVCMCRVCVLK